MTSYEVDSKLSNIITTIVNSDISDLIYNEVQSDFYISQLHLLVNRLKQQKGKRFRLKDILSSISDEPLKEQEYPRWYLASIEQIAQILLDKCEEATLLKSQQESEEIWYEWILKEPVGTAEADRDEALPKSRFLEQFIELEQYVRDIYVDLVEGATIENTNKGISEMLRELVERGVYTQKWHTSKNLQEIINLRNRIVHGQDIAVEDLDKVVDSRITISRLKSELIESYSFFVTSKYLGNKGFTVTKETRTGFDFIATKQSIHLLFDAKYASSVSTFRNIEEIFTKYKNYKVFSNTENYYILFYFQPNGRKSFDSFYQKFYDTLRDKYRQYENKVFLFYTSEYRGDASTGRLETYIEQVLKHSEKMSKLQ